jgi:hypothetical protein
METKQFRFVKNMLWPVKTTIEVGPEGITNKNKMVRWQDIGVFSYGITSINRAMNYVIVYEEKQGKTHQLNYIVSLLGSKKRKAMMAELYAMLHEGFTAHLVEPKAQELVAQIRDGETVTLQGCEVSKQGVTIQKGMMKKEQVLIQARDVELSSRAGSGGFDIGSSRDSKCRMYIAFQHGTDSRYLLAVLNQLYPSQALDIQ